MKFRSSRAKYWVLICLLSIALLTGCASASSGGDNKTNGILIECGADISQDEVADFGRSADETVKYY